MSVNSECIADDEINSDPDFMTMGEFCRPGEELPVNQNGRYYSPEVFAKAVEEYDKQMRAMVEQWSSEHFSNLNIENLSKETAIEIAEVSKNVGLGDPSRQLGLLDSDLYTDDVMPVLVLEPLEQSEE